MTVTADDNVKDDFECSLSKSYSSSSNTLGIDLWRGRRCCSGTLQLPPLSQRQSGRARTPEGDGISRPTTLPLMTLPSIAITTVSQEWWVFPQLNVNSKLHSLITPNTVSCYEKVTFLWNNEGFWHFENFFSLWVAGWGLFLSSGDVFNLLRLEGAYWGRNEMRFR